MKLMKLAEFVSTGALLMSVFHQLLAGKSGSGTGIGPPCVAAAKAGAHTTSRERTAAAMRWTMGRQYGGPPAPAA
jgi:hypothetical protein